MKESLLIRFLYNTVLGRTILKLLVNPKVSKVSSRFLSSPLSRWMIPVFIHKNKIDMDCYQIPEGGFRSFNDFFTRNVKAEYVSERSGELVSPCDGFLTVSKIGKDSVFHIKHTEYNLKELLDDEGLAMDYNNGTAFIFRLTPENYHRYIWSTTGFVVGTKHIEGLLHSVRPICHDSSRVFVQNTREYAVVDSVSIGKVIQMEIGALLVGKITNHQIRGYEAVCTGQEKGFFEYGGSSIVLLTKCRVKLPEPIKNRETVGYEIPVCVGEVLIK